MQLEETEVLGYPVKVTLAFGSQPTLVILPNYPNRYRTVLPGSALGPRYNSSSMYIVTSVCTDSYGHCTVQVEEYNH